jgi:hypothetical protein
MRGVLPWLFRWTCRTDTRDFCPALAALVGPVENIYFLIIHYFNFFLSPSPSKLGRQPCWIACLFVHVSGTHLTPTFFAAANYKQCSFPSSSVQKNNRCQCWPFVRHFFTFKIRIRNGRGGGSPIYFLASKHTHFFQGGSTPGLGVSLE